MVLSLLFQELMDLCLRQWSIYYWLSKFQKTLDEVMAGDNVGLLLRGIQKVDSERDGFGKARDNYTPY